MTAPVFPTRPPRPTVSPCDVLPDVIESIALEELALAHLINAEAEKVQKIADKCSTATPCEMIKVNESVKDTLENVIKLQMLLQFKLEDVLECVCPCPPTTPKPPCPTKKPTCPPDPCDC